MLMAFSVERTFNKLRATMHVDAKRREAAVLVLYDRRIVLSADVPKADLASVMTPEGAERWFSRDAGERGNWIEAQEYHWRMRAKQPAPAGLDGIADPPSFVG